MDTRFLFQFDQIAEDFGINELSLNESQDEYISKSHNSSFKQRFQEIVNRARSATGRSINEQWTSTDITNPYYGESFMDHLLTYMLPSIANWSGLLLGNVGRYGDSKPYVLYENNALTIENI